MNIPRVILITGVSNLWGSSVAELLLERTKKLKLDSAAESDPANSNYDYHIIGVDSTPIDQKLEGLDIIQTDIRNPLFSELLKNEEVDTVCHLDFRYSYPRSEKVFDANVIGTMKLFAACAEAGVRKIILKSSTMAYGANWDNPSFLSEAQPIQGSKKYGYIRDLVEIESFCNGYCQSSPDMLITTLRFPGIVGPRADTPMNNYLKLKLVPSLMGFDPMMQIIHEWDVIRALIHAIIDDYPGAYNVAAEGVFPLRGLIGRAGKLPLPVFHPLAYVTTDLLGVSRIPLSQIMPLDWDYLRYTWVADIKRMREVLKFVPEYSAKEAIQEFNRFTKLSRFDSDSSDLMSEPEYLRSIIDRRIRFKKIDYRAGSRDSDE